MRHTLTQNYKLKITKSYENKENGKRSQEERTCYCNDSRCYGYV